MKLFISTTSPYARKARVLLREKGLQSMVSEVVTNVYESELITEYNPLGRVPVLLDQSTVIYDSIVICQYLDNYDAGKNACSSEAKPITWDNQIRTALADGVIDSALQVVMEYRRPTEYQSEMVLKRQSAHIFRGLAACEEKIESFKASFDIPAIGLASALSYLDFRLPAMDWRQKNPKLAAWFRDINERSSMQETEFKIT